MNISLLVDRACYPGQVPHHIKIEIYSKIQELVDNDQMNKLLPLRDYFADKFNCECYQCINEFFHRYINGSLDYFNIPKKTLLNMELPAFALTDICRTSNDFLPDFSPFTILEIPLNASKRTVLANIMVKMKDNPHKMQEYRHLQAKIFDPKWRTLNEFYGHLEPDDQDNFQSKIEKVHFREVKKIAQRQQACL